MARTEECILYRNFDNGEVLDTMTSLMNSYEAGEEGFEYSGPGHRHAVQCVYHGVHQGISGFRVYLCQRGTE